MQPVPSSARKLPEWKSNASTNMFKFKYSGEPIGSPGGASPAHAPLPSAGSAPHMQTNSAGADWTIPYTPPAPASPVLPVHGEPGWRGQTAVAELIAAARAGDIAAMAEQLADPLVQEAINEEDESGKSALDHALERKAFRAVRLLVQHGARFADEDVLNPQLLSDLISADERALARDVARYRQTLTAGLRVPPPHELLGPQSPLTLAILAGDLDLVALLMGPQSFHLRDPMGNTLLHFGVAAANPRTLPFLLGRLPADALQRTMLLNAARTDGRTPLIQAAASNRATAVTVLLRAGAAIDAVDHKADTALHKAARDSFLEIGRLLLAMGARTDLRNGQQLTPMAVAREHGRPDFVELLESCGIRE